MEHINDRRTFIRNIGIGTAAALSIPLLPSAATAQAAPDTGDDRPAACDSLPAPPADVLPTSPPADVLPLQLSNGIQLDLLTRGNDFQGIGKVVAGGTILRDGAHPLSCEIRSPDGIAIIRTILFQKDISPDRILLKMNVETHAGGMMEYMLHTVRNRENLYGWVDQPQVDRQTTVELEILPLTRQINGRTWQGFSYRYSFASDHFAIYKLLDRGSWEITGKSVGNECWMRVGHVPSVVRLERVEDRYSTENYYQGIANPNVFQFLPLQTELQGFTFTAHDLGVLVTFPSKVSHVRTLIEKPHYKDHLFHYHQHCGDLSRNFRPSPVEVLWLPATNQANSGNVRINRYNVFEEVRSFVHRSLHEQAGIRQEYISTYGQIEEWGDPDFDNYTDKILPILIANGTRRLFIPNEFQNAMNTWGLSNMCCNVDFKISESVGLEKLQRFCTAAKSAGIVVEMWGNTALSTLTEMFRYKDGKNKRIDFLPVKGSIDEVIQRSKEPFVRNPSNAIEADHYTPRFAVLNFRDADIMNYWMASWKEAYRLGIGAIFLDSSFNMTSDKFHYIQNLDKDKPGGGNTGTVKEGQGFYRPLHEPPSAILSQYPAHLQLVRDMQQAGYAYCGEDLGVFGVHRHGPDMDRILPTMPLWRECIINFETGKLPPGMDPLVTYFKGLAYRISWAMRWDFQRGLLDTGISDPRAHHFVKAFNAVNDLMREREILPEEQAVQYTSDDGRTKVLWTIDPYTATFGSRKKVWDVITGRKYVTNRLAAGPLGVFVIS